ncbi:Tom37 C-terminal domain-domain-containing protein [Microdochium bolleyi]|uniref:Tom37 C-terminal domain-domain-containing protein n=1 Tax=Microdochium bolleyi TaxID=196109 RepID=A0A136IXE5_9PEZI|nr:Tom37 C-terminal domain-domain-containing protein [Microdochium bolleyi]
MVFTLHIWGPAFGQASVDPECVASAEFLRHTLAPDSWALIASNDTLHHTLPALVDEQGVSVSGYTNIVKYLCDSARTDIDNDLTPRQRADAAALTAYLSTRGSALLSLALYVSHSAWVGVTRPAYSQLLPFPLTWTIPPAIRSAAIDRVGHLGLGHLAASVDDLDEQSGGSGSGATTTATGFLQLPERFGPSKTLQPEQTAAIRLQSLAEDFFSVVQDHRKYAGEDSKASGFMFGRDEPSSADFLVFAYLKLMRVETPQPFLRNAMQKSFPALWALSEPQHLQAALSITTQAPNDDGYPWQDPAPRGAAGLLGKFADGALGHVPSVGPAWTRYRQSKCQGSGALQTFLALGAVGTAALAAAGLAVFIKGLAPLGAPVHRFEATQYAARDKGAGKEGEQGFHRFGNDLGAMLSHLPDFSPAGRITPSPPTRDTVYNRGDVEVKVDVEPAPNHSPIVDAHV